MSKKQIAEDTSVAKSGLPDGINGESKLTAKDLADTINGWATIAYKAAAAVGAIVTFAYIFTINHFPSGLTPGEVVFFVFVALAFGFLYSISLLYGSFSSVWIIQILVRTLWLMRFRVKLPIPSKRLVKLKAVAKCRKDNPPGRIRRRCRKITDELRRFRRICTRLAIHKKGLLPAPGNGALAFFASLLVFSLMAGLYFEVPSQDLRKLLVSFLAGGIMLIVFATDTPGGDSLRNMGWRRWLIWVGVPFVMIVTAGGPMPLLLIAFKQLGIRMENVSIEIPESERPAIERISDAIGHPIIDCHKGTSARMVVHGANILWTGIGTQTVASFAGSRREMGNKTTKNGKVEATVSLETKDIRIFKIEPISSLCFDLPADVSFDSGKYDLTTTAAQQLEGLVDSMQTFGLPERIKVRGHSDPRPLRGLTMDNQKLSELRAKAVAETLKGLIKAKELQMTHEGVGSLEPKVTCPTVPSIGRYEVEQCNRPNRRVEIQIELKPHPNPTT